MRRIKEILGKNKIFYLPAPRIIQIPLVSYYTARHALSNCSTEVFTDMSEPRHGKCFKSTCSQPDKFNVFRLTVTLLSLRTDERNLLMKYKRWTHCWYGQKGLNLLQSLGVASKHVHPLLSQGWKVCAPGQIPPHLSEYVLNSAKEENDKLSSSVMQT